ncbi:MAG: undecaprenyldiphospho-muramoylpentapeptide beta-N-acetylglucosaminyltransferase [Halioglobus sp.]
MSKQQPLVLITTGGTGGHVYPGLAVAQELRERGYRVAWLGTRSGLENRVVPANGIDMYYMPVRGVRGKGFFKRLRGLFLVWFATLRALWILLRLRPACVVGLGGYVAGPAGVAAWLLRRPLIIHEQNSIAGTTNRLLAPLARRVACGFSGAFAEKRKAVVTGNPLRADIIAAGAGNSYSYDGSQPLKLLVLGGSLGASAINDAVPGALRRLSRDGVKRAQVWHQAGEAHYPEMYARYHDHGSDWARVAPFIEDMATAYRWADLVLCRAGALTVAELAVMGRPAILVPYPYAIDDHQRFNAQSLVDAGAGVLMLQSELDASRLSRLLRELHDDPKRLDSMAAAAHRLARPGATREVCDLCEELING